MFKYNYNDSKGYIYLIRNGNNEYKIGKSNNPNRRLLELQTASPTKLTLIYSVYCDYYNNIETSLHNYLNSYKIRGEFFNLPLEIVTKFEQLCKKMENNIITLLDNTTNNLDNNDIFL